MTAVSPRAEVSTSGSLFRRLARAGAWVSHETLLIVVVATVASVWSLDLTGGLRADSWLTLLGGREILAHGLPRHDALAIVSHGRDWVDQQWLSQLFFYELFRIGGLGLVLRVNVVLFLAPLCACLVAARRRGASAPRVLLVALPALLFTATFLRAQVLSQVLFVGVLLLLLVESRRPTWRIALAAPLLVLWANLHGAVVVGAALTAALGLVELARWIRLAPVRRAAGLVRPAALLALPWLAVLATPYGFDVVEYYRSTIGNPLLPRYVSEWHRPEVLSFWGLPFYCLGLLAAFLVVRRPRRLNGFELAALAVTFAAGALAVRSIIWFLYASTILLPALLEDVWPQRSTAAPAARDRLVRVAAVGVSLVLCLVLFLRAKPPLEEKWPSEARSAVARTLARDPEAKVLANAEYADWLLFTVPSARGRVAFDGRWEVLSQRQFQAVMSYLTGSPSAVGFDRPYGLIVVDPRVNRALHARLATRRDLRAVFRGRRVVVYERVART